MESTKYIPAKYFLRLRITESFEYNINYYFLICEMKKIINYYETKYWLSKSLEKNIDQNIIQ